MGNFNTLPERIRPKDIEKLRSRMYLGKIVEEKIYFDKLGERLKRPRRKEMVVCGIYPHLIEIQELGEPDKLPRLTKTYVDMLMEQAQKKGEDNV